MIQFLIILFVFLGIATPIIPVNFRDAGGKRTLDGGRTRQGMIFRGSELSGTHYNITPEGVRFMREELKIRTDLDLRYPKKTARITASPLGDGVRWVRRPVNVPATALTALLAGIYFGSRKLVKGGLSPIALIVLSALSGIGFYSWC